MSWHYFVFPIAFFIAGIFHLIKPKAFTRIMPLYIPYHKPLVYISGIFEIAIAIGLLLPQLRNVSIIAAIIMLILFFPVHIHMLVNKKASLNLPKSLLIFRLILQFVLIYWLSTYI